MNAYTDRGYPRSLSYFTKKIVGYSRNNVRLVSVGQNSCINGNVIVVDMPSNALLDLSTFTAWFTAVPTVTAGFAAMPVDIESIIENISVEINGQVVSGSANYLNHLYEILFTLTCGNDARNRRGVLQNASDGAVPTVAAVATPYMIQNWPGFISSVSPNIINSGILGNIRIRITLTGANCLIQNATSVTAGGAGFSLSNIFFSVDTVDIQDGLFHQLNDKFLSSGSVYQIPYYNWFSFSSSGPVSQSTKFSLSTQSLNRIIGTLVSGSAYPINSITPQGGTIANATAGANLDPVSKRSSFFTRIGAGSGAGTVINYGNATNGTAVTYNVSSYQFSLNNVLLPQWLPTPEQAYGHMLNSFGLSQDTLGGVIPTCNNLGAWLSSFWISEIRLDHGESVSVISGVNTQGSSLNGYYTTNGTATQVVTGAGAGPGTNVQCLVFCQTTSMLEVGFGRQITVIL